MYSRDDVCAAIISYNCDDMICENIQSLLNQVKHVCVIDNGSSKKSIDILSKWEKTKDVTIIYKNENKGVAQRLNEALVWADNNGYRLLLMMDQDTVLLDGCVEKMLFVMNQDERYASVGPNRKHKLTHGFKETTYLITSGNLVVIQAAKKAGGFMSDLFIDLVDIEFSLAMRKAGYCLVVSNGALMRHCVGIKETRKIMGFTFNYQSHSPQRFFYIYRNHVIVVKKYFKQFPVFCIKMLVSLCIDSIKMCFENESKQKRRMAYKGFMEGMRLVREQT